MEGVITDFAYAQSHLLCMGYWMQQPKPQSIIASEFWAGEQKTPESHGHYLSGLAIIRMEYRSTFRRDQIVMSAKAKGIKLPFKVTCMA